MYIPRRRHAAGHGDGGRDAEPLQILAIDIFSEIASYHNLNIELTIVFVDV